MSQETVSFKNERAFFSAFYEDDDAPYFEYKEEKLSDFDSEKGMVNVKVFLQRTSDNKKFTAEYTRGSQGNNWVNDLKFYEKPTSKPKEKKFTISEIKEYIISQDSLGDVLYNLTAENIIKTNKK